MFFVSLCLLFQIVYFDFMFYVENVKESSKGLELGGDGS